MCSAAPGSPIWRAAGFGWLLLSSSAEPSIGFSFFFNCNALRPWAFRSCSRSLMVSGSWFFSCWAWDKASSTCLSSANRASLFADRSEIFCFSASPEDFKVPMFLCFSSAKSFSFIISSRGGDRPLQAGIGQGEIGHHWPDFPLLLNEQKLVLPIDHKTRICLTTCSKSRSAPLCQQGLFCGILDIS